MKFEDFIKQNNIEIKDIDYKIVKIKEKQDYVVIYLDNDEKINISVENYFKYYLSKTKGLDEDTYLKLKNEEITLLAYKKAINKLSQKDYTVKQISDYLKIKHNLEYKDIDIIIEKLKNYDLLNDEKYCINRINYLNKDNLSIKQIKVKLLKEGIKEELIEKYLINDYKEELNKCLNIASKYERSIKNKSSNLKKQSILNKLVGLGYSYDLAKSAVDSLNIEVDNEYELCKREYARGLLKYSKKYKDYELKNKIYAYLLSKGFSASMIKEVEK